MSIIKFTILPYLLCALLSGAGVHAQEQAAGAAMLSRFTASDNAIEKRELLASLKSTVAVTGKETPAWVLSLIDAALGDEDPVVVAEAASQIGLFELAQYAPSLIQLYNDAETKYAACGYVERVRYAIVPSLGKIGNTEAAALIRRLLREDNATDLGEYLLFAIKDINDPRLAVDVQEYSRKMQGYVDRAKRMGYDPLIYSRPLLYIRLAAEIEKSLVSKGGR